MSVYRGQAYYELTRAPIVDMCGHMYHGVDRHFAAVGVDWDRSTARDVWREYCCAGWEDLGAWDAFFPSLDVAHEFQSRFGDLGNVFGIIAVYPCESAADVVAIEGLAGYLGLDVSTTEPNSVLRPEALWNDIDCTKDASTLRALWAIPPKYFRARVNKYGLLTSYADAVLFRDVMRALEQIDRTGQSPAAVRVLGVQEIGP